MVKVEVSIRGGAEEDKPMVINVKEGKQSFKWLAAVIQTRLSTPSNFRTVSADETVCKLVSKIHNSDEELINPRDSVADHADKDGLCKCIATIVTSFPSDVWGNPEYDEWAAAAYLRSDMGSQWATDQTKWRQRLAQGLIDASGRLADTTGMVVVTSSSRARLAESESESKGVDNEIADRKTGGDDAKAETKGGEGGSGDGAQEKARKPRALPPGPTLKFNREAGGASDNQQEQQQEQQWDERSGGSGHVSAGAEDKGEGSTRLRHK